VYSLKLVVCGVHYQVWNQQHLPLSRLRAPSRQPPPSLSSIKATTHSEREQGTVCPCLQAQLRVSNVFN
jgi:hypothetical protein